ncbi:vWA domain-containing protein [Georgenia ruanii]|nr:VWA domain-containing protein [Georgenia ruanii]MPV90360.1 VWA domain-containing protein [Georgenia ruanii]
MHIATHLDVDVLTLEDDATLSLLLEITAPTPSTDTQRPAATLEVVLDRSGSMSGAPLEGAKAALLAVVDRLDPHDRFGVVTFDTEAAVVVPAGPLKDKAAVKRAIERIGPGGMTDLAAGYLRGLKEARRAATAAGATLALISDGHANSGETRPDVLGAVAAKARTQGVTTSSLGYGLGYDERLLSALARGGAGNEAFAEDPDAAGQAIAGEVDGLLSQAAQAATLLVTMSPAVRALRVVNDLPTNSVEQGVQVELGGLYAGETRKLVLTFDIPGLSTLGLLQVAELTLNYVELPALEEHTITVPVHVNVVPGDDAAGRVPDPVVRTELAYLEAQRAKREASTLLSKGDAAAALRHLQSSAGLVGDALAGAPAAMVADLREEAASLTALMADVHDGALSRAAKTSSMEASVRSRTRGRRRPSATF